MPPAFSVPTLNPDWPMAADRHNAEIETEKMKRFKLELKDVRQGGQV